MTNNKDKAEIISVANAVFPDSFVAQSATFWEGSVNPTDLLARFVVATIDDLCGQDSSREANLERVALALETGAANLQGVAQNLRRKVRS